MKSLPQICHLALLLCQTMCESSDISNDTLILTSVMVFEKTLFANKQICRKCYHFPGSMKVSLWRWGGTASSCFLKAGLCAHTQCRGRGSKVHSGSRWWFSRWEILIFSPRVKVVHNPFKAFDYISNEKYFFHLISNYSWKSSFGDTF